MTPAARVSHLIAFLAVSAATSIAAQTPPGSQAQPPSAGPSVKLGGYVQARETYQNGPGLTGTLNRARVSADGSIAGGFSYRVLVEYESGGNATTAATVSLRDAYIKWSRAGFAITAGQYKTPFTREYLTSITQIETADRSTVVDSLAPKRDIGILGEYAYRAYGSILLGVFNGEGQNRPVNKDSTVLMVGRVTGRPIAQLNLGANIAYYSSDSTRYGVDAALEHRGLTLKGEYLWQRRKANNPDDHGWYALGAYRVLPWVQLVVKQEDLCRSAISPTQRNQATTAGVNLEFTGGKIRLIGEYVSRKIGTPGVRRGAMITQLQFRF